MEGSSSPPAESPAEDKHLCPVCHAKFAFEKSQRRHVRNKHPEAASSSNREKTYACDLCSNVFLHRRELLQHHEQEHGFVTRRSTLEFSSRAEFQAWKEKTEREEQVQFIATRGATRLSSGATKRYLECHRSGVSVQSGQGKRQPKAVGSVKCNKHCFATMVVTQDGDKVNVEYQAEHYGHEKSVAHLRLSATEVDAIAQKLSIGVPIRRILADAHSSELDRLRTLTTKDIYNIKYKYRIGSEQRDPEETQALLDSIQADVIPEPQISGLENIRTLLGAALQDLANKESGDPALLELAVKKAYEIRLLVKQFPDKQPSVAKPIAANKTLEKQPGY
ncbi:uncharacterized protein LOC144127874 [Amblyomma americanum]